MTHPQRMISSVDVVLTPQYVKEGSTPSTYGKTPSNPSFTPAGQRGMISKSNEPEFIDNDFSGKYDRQGIIKTRERNTLVYRGRMMPTELPLLKWAMGIPSGDGSPDEARTWMYSYRNNTGDEIYCVFRGCKPSSASISITPNDVTMLEITMTCQTYVEGTSHGMNNPDFSYSEVQGTPIRFKDWEDFYYDTNQLNFRNLTLTTSFSSRMQDSLGSETDLYVEPAARRITGSIDIFKTGATYNEDARLGVQKISWLGLRKSSGTDAKADAQIPGGSVQNYITFESRVPGAFGNTLSIASDDRTGATTTASLDVDRILIRLKTGGDTLQNVKSAIDNNDMISQLITATITGDATTNLSSVPTNTALTGGTDKTDKIVLQRFRLLPSNEDLIDTSDATMESKSCEADALSVIYD